MYPNLFFTFTTFILHYMHCCVFDDHEPCGQLILSAINKQVRHFIIRNLISYGNSVYHEEGKLTSILVISRMSFNPWRHLYCCYTTHVYKPLNSNINVTWNFNRFELIEWGVLYHSLYLCHLLRLQVIWYKTNFIDRVFASEFHFDGSVKCLLFPLQYL